jgi:RsiW-degrading membrane proteinase PrsW (M82 family)
MGLIKVAVSLTPVFLFLALLVVLDSYKLVRTLSVIRAILIGCVAALASLPLNYWLLQNLAIENEVFSQFVVPIVEEVIKSAYLFYLIRTKKVGFMVDAVIYGFAIGAGFAFVENIYYLLTLESSNILLWIVRGFGTAALHGATTAVLGILSKSLSDRRQSDTLMIFMPGLLAAIGIHMAFNNFIIPPVPTTIIMLIILPILLVFIFVRSEKATQAWLGGYAVFAPHSL